MKKTFNRNTSIDVEKQRIWDILAMQTDPEVPALTITDLGIVRDVVIHESAATGVYEAEVFITPTYSGCPAMDVISMNIRLALIAEGYESVKITQVLSPAWTTEWMSEQGKQKLREYGIAPPNPKQQVCNNQMFAPDEAVQCPHCNSYHTIRISEFGSTPCKALYQCKDCHEPFDYFKCH
jgi:ring-1,2-phenylacetyl-CoA epoxidase subunit PaaD